MAGAYYNENDPFAAAWLRELIRARVIAQGEVDDRSITDVRPDDLRGFTQCHFFAGIGVWSYALRRAGWPDDQRVWTGSCPCQPFSVAGRHTGSDDERHLWPVWFALIEQCRPPAIFGEQVASAGGLGWLDGVCADLEGAHYAIAACDLGAAGFGSPTRRQRLYWVAQPCGSGLEGFAGDGDEGREPGRDDTRADRPAAATGAAGAGSPGVDAVPVLRRVALHDSPAARPRLPLSPPRRLADGSVFRRFDVVPCRDGWRRVESGAFPLAHGPAARVGRLRGYGNALVADVAEAFIRAYIEVEGSL